MFTIRVDLREAPSGIPKLLDKMCTDGSVTKPNTFEIIEEVLTVGDYIIECGNYILIIERKANADLSSSIIDGRIRENHPKLLDAASSDCGPIFRVMYIIEGKKFKPEDANKKIGVLCVASLQAKVDHMMMADGCQIEYTPNQTATAMRLIELGKNLTTLKGVNGGGKKIDIGPIVKKNYTKSVLEIQMEMIMCVPGVGPKRAASMLANLSFPLIIASEKLPEKLAPEKIMLTLEQLRQGELLDVFKKMLVKINGISNVVANIIIEHNEISILNIDPVIIANLERENGRRIGIVLANRIVEHFSQ
jgi:ERCC4-type nuclease